MIRAPGARAVCGQTYFCDESGIRRVWPPPPTRARRWATDHPCWQVEPGARLLARSGIWPRPTGTAGRNSLRMKALAGARSSRTLPPHSMTRNGHVSFIWSIADQELRGQFKQSEYGRIILPFVVLRRLEVLAPT